jgi:hypothetical protein
LGLKLMIVAICNRDPNLYRQCMSTNDFTEGSNEYRISE